MKQFALSLALLSAVSVASASKLDFDLTVNAEQTIGSYEFDGPAFDINDQFAGYFFAWEQEGLITLGNNEGDSLKLVVRARK
jgi:hypothetical protein